MSRRKLVHVPQRKLWHVIFFIDPLYLICGAAFVVGGLIGAVSALVRS